MTEPRVPLLRRFEPEPIVLVELFAASNLAFLAVDIFVAHAINNFAEPAEWVPIVFSPLATILLGIAFAIAGLRPARVVDRNAPRALRRRIARAIGLLVGGSSLVVGIAGLLYHLSSQFFADQTIKHLVYTAPFAAPLSYAGIGLLLVLNRLVDSKTLEWGRWVVILALGGVFGNFVLTLADHAQNGFFNPGEWIAVIAAAIGVGALVAVVALPTDRLARRFAFVVLAFQVGVALLGFYYHVAANLASPLETFRQKFLYGAPAFAPLLFADLAVLAAIGLWSIDRQPLAPNESIQSPAVADAISRA